MKLIIIAVIAVCVALTGVAYGIESTGHSECFEKLNSADLELTNRQINNACEEISETGEAFIEGFRDRGLIIYWVNLGDTVSIHHEFLFR